MSAVPEISVIIPARNAARTLPAVLEALDQSREDREIIAVDDGSTDDTGKILEQHGVDVLLRHDRRHGQWPSRNEAVARARGRILLFVDSDVVVGPETLPRVRAFFANGGAGGEKHETNRRALIGVYALAGPTRGICTRYKNAWIRYSYLKAQGNDWFFTGIGALPAKLFAEAGGFSERFRVETGGGDIEFGRRLQAASVDIAFDRELQATHLKTFSLRQLLRNDCRRAYGWSRLALRSGEGLARLSRRGMANVSGAFVAGVALTWLTVLAAALGWAAEAPAATWAPLVPWALVNAPFWKWIARRESAGLALCAIPLTFLDQAVCGLGVARAVLESRLSDRLPSRVPAPARGEPQI